MPSDRRHLVVVPLASLLAVLPMIVFGCSCGHDFDFHIINWFEAAKQFAHGTLHPHWVYTPAWNTGEPRFVFYPPLSWTIGAVLGLILPWSWAPVAYIWLALTLAGLALHSVVRHFASSNAALVAAVLYLVNPYMLYTFYERSAYAELLATAWLPLLLGALLRPHVRLRAVAIPIALLWLTNAPAAVMGCYATALLALLRLALWMRSRAQSRLCFIFKTAAGTLLGLGLSAFYLLPAAYERRFVQIGMSIVPGLSPQDNFLFHRTVDLEHDAVLRTASFVALVLIVLTVTALLFLRLQPASISEETTADHRYATPPRLPLVFALLSAGIVLLLTPLSTPLWHYLPELRFLQFPWRLLAVLAVVFACATALALSRLSLRPVATSLIAAIAFAFPAYAIFHQRCYPEDTLAERLAIFHSGNPGTDPTEEYTPIGAENSALGQNNPGYWIAQQDNDAPPTTARPGPAPHQLELNNASDAILVLNLRDYPSWRITRNGEPVAERPHRDDGLIAIPLPAGHSQIQVRYAVPRDQQAGYLFSALSLLLLTMLLVRASREPDAPLRSEPAEVRILGPYR